MIHAEPRARLTSGVARAHLALLALIAYVPALLTKPGRLPTDTKLYLYLNPGRLIADAPFSWDTRQFGGWVPHQTIAYLWPQGPWYWVMDKLGLPDWVAHRLWIGTLLFLGAWGVMWAARQLGLSRGGAVAAAVMYQLSPYVLPYLSRTSAMLLPWAAVGWIVGLTIRSATSGHRWRHPALLALVVLSCSAVNATAILMVAPAPVLWLLHAVLQRALPWRRAVATAARIGALSAGVCLWWVFMLRAQGLHGADLLSYSESLQATSLTSTSMETLRGAGYWLFYVRDPYAFTTTAAQSYMESGKGILLSFGLIVLALGGVAFTRWSQRRYAALLVTAGIVLAVGVHPIADPSALMTPLAEHSRSTLSLMLRSSTRALPLSNFGLALGLGALVTSIGASRLRLRALAPAFAVLLAVANLPALWNGGLVDPALERAQDPPTAWQQAADSLSAMSPEYRVMQLPGSEFGAFRWGYTVDPPLPGMTTKPLITRDLLPLGSPAVMDLLYALDDRVQTNTLDAASLAPVARLLGVDTLWLPNDIAFDRFRTPRPSDAAAAIGEADDIGAAQSFGEASLNIPDIPVLDEHALVSARQGDQALPPVQLQPVKNPVPIVRATNRVVELVGSGDGLIDAAAAGLVHGDEAVLYAADRAARPDDSAAPSMVILTDSNRDRAHHWRSSQDVTGFTEAGGTGSDVLQPDEADARLPVFGDAPAAQDQTTAHLSGDLVVQASGYGEPFAYRPEQRPAMAVDGDPSTAWVVADRANPIGQYFTVSGTDGTLTLLQPQGGSPTRALSSVRIDTAAGASIDVPLGPSSLSLPGQHLDLPDNSALRITITGIVPLPEGTDTGPSAVGFAELGLGTHTEVVQLPTYDAPADTPLAVVLTRLRTDPLNRWRSDPEQRLVRSFATATDRTFHGTVTLRPNGRASDRVLNQLLGDTGTIANRRLTGDIASRGIFATDHDADTAWTSPFNDAVGSELTITVGEAGVDTFDLLQPTDELHSVITNLHIEQGDLHALVTVPAPDADGRSTVTLQAPLRPGSASITVTGIEPRFTLDRRFGERTSLPVAIRELTAAAIGGPDSAGDFAPSCNSNLATLDGAPLGLLLDEGVLARFRAGEAAQVPTCSGDTDGDQIVLPAGTHQLETVAGLTSGIDIDRVVLTTDGEAAGASTPVQLQRTRLTRTATVAPCPTGCWLIMGEGRNAAWTASVGGAAAVPSAPVSGGMNGWWVPPSTSPTTVHIEWTGQTPVTAALIVSLLAVLVCMALAMRRRPSTRAAIEFAPAPPRLGGAVLAPVSFTRGVASGVVLVASAWLIASPGTAVTAGAIAVVMVATRRPRIAGVVAAVLMAGLSAQVLLGQRQHSYFANAAWPGWFEHLHHPGMLVVALLLAATVVS